MSDITTLPVAPLRETVVFPGVTLSIRAGRPGTLKAIQAASRRDDRLLFAVTQRQDRRHVRPEHLYTIGTIAQVDHVNRVSNGLQVVLSGIRRGIAMRITESEGLLQAVVREAEEMTPTDPDDPAFRALLLELRERAAELALKSGMPEDTVQLVLTEASDPSRLADLVISYLEIPTSERQALLENLSVEERLRLALIQVQRQLSVVDAQHDIQSRVQQELGDRQREMVLREQLKAIQKELGEDGEHEDLAELRTRLAELELPETARTEVERELGRLGRVSRDSMEHQVIRSFLETVAELPWNERSDDLLDLANAAAVLDEDHYGLEDPKDRVLEFLAVRRLRSRESRAEASGGGGTEPEGAGTKAPILLFLGPPGVGKTSIAQSMARAMGREYARVSLGGARDEADIRGHRRTYVGAMPGRIIQGMRQAGTRNPVFLLDEVDKLGASFQGDPASALLEVLDPAQNDSFVDHYLGIPFDLSEVFFIATANFVEHIPAPLLDRMEVVEFAGYTEQEKHEIARRYLLPRQVRESALGPEEMELDDAALRTLISGYTREAGVRQLERELGKLARKVARKIASDEVQSVRVDDEAIVTYLGRPRLHPEKAAAEDQIGVATGMYYTPVGGDIMFVEATTMRGSGELVLTGQLGDVMRESARAAWSYARSHAEFLGIEAERFERDLHIHAPAGAIPKDGPSAGVTMATAVVSALSGCPVRHDLAMTGEITLTGRILPIGGVKEKVLGGVRAGIETFLLPRLNAADLDDLPTEVRSLIEVHLVEDLGEVLRLAIPGVVSVASAAVGSDGDRRPGLSH